MPFAINDGVRTYYEVQGDRSNPPIFLHGGGFGDHTMWAIAGYLERLSGSMCVLFDQRGRGLSDKPLKREAHLMENYVSDVITVLDDLGIERTTFWGYSDGGRVGFALASRYPRRVAGLISSGNWGQWMSTQFYNSLVAGIHEGGMLRVVEEIERGERLVIPAPVKKNILETDGEVYALNESVWNWERAPLVSDGFSTPTLLLVGGLEDPGGESEQLAQRLPACRLVKVEGMGHVGAYLESARAVPEALRFVKSVQGD